MDITQEYEDFFLDEFRVLVVSEWEEVDQFDHNKFGSNLPKPILAINDGELLGGLSFTWYPDPVSSDIALWINTVYVKEKMRGQGIGTRLVSKAMQCVSREADLFAYTKVPNLYKSIGWREVSGENGNFVLMRAMSGA